MLPRCGWSSPLLSARRGVYSASPKPRLTPARPGRTIAAVGKGVEKKMVIWIIGAILVFIAVVSFGGMGSSSGILMRVREPERWRRSMYLVLALLVGGIALIVIGLVG